MNYSMQITWRNGHDTKGCLKQIVVREKSLVGENRISVHKGERRQIELNGNVLRNDD